MASHSMTPLGHYENLNLPSFLTEYRDAVFPRSLRSVVDPDGSIFCLSTPSPWATEGTLALYMYIKSGNAVPSSERDMVILNATIAQVLAYRNFLLPPVLYSHPTFSLLNVNNWIHVDHFAAFLRVSRRHDPSSPLVCITSKALEAEELERKREREFLYPDFSLGGGIQPEQPAESNAKSLVPSGKYRSMSMTEFLNANMTAEELEQVSEDWLLGRD